MKRKCYVDPSYINSDGSLNIECLEKMSLGKSMEILPKLTKEQHEEYCKKAHKCTGPVKPVVINEEYEEKLVENHTRYRKYRHEDKATSIADDFLWQQFKQLDIDHTLQKYQLETCNDVAMALITSLSGHSVFSENTKQNFESVRENIQNLLNERTDKVGSFGMYIDISKINLNSKIGNSTLWEWAKRMDKITKRDYRDEFLRKYKKEFYKTFFKSIFASDFSKRDRAIIQ